MSEYILIQFTSSDLEEAQKIIATLLEKKLIACASAHPEMMSYYVWKGVKQSEKEFEIVLKTKNHHFDAICAIIEDIHSYDCCQIIQTPFKANKKYLDWIEESV